MHVENWIALGGDISGNIYSVTRGARLQSWLLRVFALYGFKAWRTVTRLDSGTGIVIFARVSC